MTGFDIYNNVMSLLGIEDNRADIFEQSLKMRTLSAINRIGDDLCLMEPIKDLMSGIKMPPLCMEALPYGVCMLLSLTDGDNSKNELFVEIYNSKRAKAKASLGARKNILPQISGV